MRCVNARHNNAISRDSRILISAINSLRHRTSAWVDSGCECGDSLNSGNGFECRCGRVVFAWKQKWKKKGSRNDYIAGLSLANWSLVLLFLDVRDWALLELASRSNRARAGSVRLWEHLSKNLAKVNLCHPAGFCAGRPAVDSSEATPPPSPASLAAWNASRALDARGFARWLAARVKVAQDLRLD